MDLDLRKSGQEQGIQRWQYRYTITLDIHVTMGDWGRYMEEIEEIARENEFLDMNDDFFDGEEAVSQFEDLKAYNWRAAVWIRINFKEKEDALKAWDDLIVYIQNEYLEAVMFRYEEEMIPGRETQFQEVPGSDFNDDWASDDLLQMKLDQLRGRNLPYFPEVDEDMFL